MQENTDYYSILEVSRTASDEDIKKAYKKLAIKWHPDRNNNSNESSEMFKQIAKAYEILGNPESKSKYDCGDLDDEINESDAFTMFASTFGDFFKMHGIGLSNFNLDDFIDDADDIVVDCINYVNASIEDMYTGATIPQQYDRYSECEKCNGFGTKSGKLSNCKKCKGAGHVPISVGNTTVAGACPSCNGSCIDKAVAKCVECKGAKFSPETVEVDLDILPGSRDGTKIVVKGEGNAIPPEEVKRYGVERSDAIFIVKEKPHDKFKRGLIIPGKSKLDFGDVMVELNISFEESIIGFTKNVTHPSGNPFKFSMSEPCRHGDTIVIEGNGMPKENNPTSYGDLFVKIQVDRPIVTADTKKNLSKVLGYTHTPSKTNTKHMLLDEYSKKQQLKKTSEEKQPTKKKTSTKAPVKTSSDTDSDESIPTAPIVDTNKKTKSTGKTAGRPAKSTTKSTSKKQKLQVEAEYPTDSDDDYGLTVFHNAHEKHRPHILTKQPYNMTPEELKNYQVANPPKPQVHTQIVNSNPFDQPIFQNMKGFKQGSNGNNMNGMEAMKAMEVFKNFPGMQNMMGMNFDSDDDNFPFQSNGKGTYTSTMTHPDGHTTTTTTRTFVNGEEMDLADIPGLDPDFLAGIPELENIPGLHGLFGIGKKKTIKN